MPINHRVHAHERRPPAVRGVEVREIPAMWVRAARADEDGGDVWVAIDVVGKGGLHGEGRGGEGELVGGRGGLDEDVNLGEGVGWDDVD